MLKIDIDATVGRMAEALKVLDRSTLTPAEALALSPAGVEVQLAMMRYALGLDGQEAGLALDSAVLLLATAAGIMIANSVQNDEAAVHENVCVFVDKLHRQIHWTVDARGDDDDEGLVAVKIVSRDVGDA